MNTSMVAETSEQEPRNGLPQRLQSFYELLGAQREGSIGGLPDLFTLDIHYRDPFRETLGMDAFRKLFVRMFKQYRTVAFTEFRVNGEDRAFTLTYKMHLRMAIGPTFVTPIASVCLARGDKICELCDYFDFSSSLLSPFPIAAAAYRKTVNALFL
jgi:hypothetical protein